MLLIGASHINHLESFVNSRHTPFKYSLPFRKTFFIGVGGTKWEKCLEHFNGRQLTTSNKHRGDQWSKYYTSGIKPVYRVISMGSNSVDETDQKIRKVMGKKSLSDADMWKEARKLQQDRLTELKPIVANVINVIKQNAPYSEQIYIPILPHHWWHPLSRELARYLDKHVVFGLKRRFRVKDIWPAALYPKRKFSQDSCILAGMLDTDEVHLNGYGNRALIGALCGPILQKWLTRLGAKKKATVEQRATKSKKQKKKKSALKKAV